jgi:hypothetical protein
MGENGADVDFLAVVVDGGDQSDFVAANVEDSEFADLIGGGKGVSQFGEAGEVILFDEAVPLDEGIGGLRIAGGKFVEAFSRDHMHVKGWPPGVSVVLVPRCGVGRRGR